MMMMRTLRLALLAAAMAVATVAFGWWGIPVVGAAWGVVARRQRGPALSAALAAMLAWGALLIVAAARGPVGTLAHELGSVFALKAIGVYAITLALPGLLAVTAAVVARSLATARA
jgi:hypothetical protein